MLHRRPPPYRTKPEGTDPLVFIDIVLVRDYRLGRAPSRSSTDSRRSLRHKIGSGNFLPLVEERRGAPSRGGSEQQQAPILPLPPFSGH